MFHALNCMQIDLNATLCLGSNVKLLSERWGHSSVYKVVHTYISRFSLIDFYLHSIGFFSEIALVKQVL